jgi:hypothetical protein
MDFPLYFQKVRLLWQRSIVEIDYGFSKVFGPYFIGKSLGTFKTRPRQSVPNSWCKILRINWNKWRKWD